MAFPGVSQLQSLTASGLSHRVAVIPAIQQYSTNQTDTEVRLFEDTYLRPVGRFALVPFLVGGASVAAHGRWVFFDETGTSLFVLAQAEPGSGLLEDYILQTIDTVHTDSCSASLSTQTASVPAAGSLGSFLVTAPADCNFAVQSDSPWVQVVSGGLGSGTGGVSYIVRPNHSPQARTGLLTTNGESLQISQDGFLNPGAFQPLSFRVAAADFSKSLNKLILASGDPDELHIYDSVSKADQVVALPAPPLSVSVSPDGLYAAVGHDGWVSYIDLQNASLLQVYTAPLIAHGIALAGDGYVYAFPASDWASAYSLQLATGSTTGVQAIYVGMFRGRIRPGIISTRGGLVGEVGRHIWHA